VDVISSLDQSGFGDLANKTDGKFALVADGDGDWRTLYDHGLLTLPGAKQNAENVQAWRELYAIFLFPALLLFVLMYIPFRLKKIQPLAAVFLVFSFAASIGVHEVYAAEADAYAAYRNHSYTQAQALYGEQAGYGGRMGEGATAYRRKDYPYAIKQFSSALLESRNDKQREQALFNLGNSYFMAAGYRAAADAFLGVLHYAPENQDARANLALAAGKLAEISKSGKKSQGIPGRRGRETGGGQGEDASDKPVSLEPSDAKKDKTLRAGNDMADSDKARLNSDGKQSVADSGSAVESDITYRAALKKLELSTDDPLPLHKALIRIEAAREYVPQAEMSPW
jgi:Ca-activated chloride channel family protein